MELATIISLREKTLTAARSAGLIHLTTEELFRAYSIMATGAVYLNQESFVHGSTEDIHIMASPVDLFSVAMRSAKQVNMLYGIQGIQNLLLVARFCFFQDVGMSLWDLASLNMRTCIECGFHRQPTAPLPAMEEQMRRRVFWQCYGLERYASTTLGRPFTIPDEAITVKLPANIDDSVLQEAASLLPNTSLDELTEAQALPKGLTDTSVAISHIQLRQITSRMSRDYRILRSQLLTSQDSPGSSRNSADGLDLFTLNGKVWSIYYQYSQELHNWRLYSGMHTHKDIAPDSNGQLFLHDSRWIDLHFHQEKLFLIRLSIEPNSATDSHFINPGDLLEELYDAASNVIILYSDIADDAKIEPTAGRLYRVLTAGLSILYTIVIESQMGQTKNKQHNGPSRPPPSRQTISGKKLLLRKCTDTLDRMAKQMTNQHLTPRYVGYFELLCRETLRILPKSTVQESTTSDSSGQQAFQHSVRQTHPSATSTAAISTAFAPMQDVSPDYFGSSLITAPLTCHLPVEHRQPCCCAVIGNHLEDPSGATSWPDFLTSEVGIDGVPETYDPAAMFGSEWGEATEIWEALFGNGQLWATESSSFY
jgi:Zn ribbon nucleic-acid-binding protein